MVLDTSVIVAILAAVRGENVEKSLSTPFPLVDDDAKFRAVEQGLADAGLGIMIARKSLRLIAGLLLAVFAGAPAGPSNPPTGAFRPCRASIRACPQLTE